MAERYKSKRVKFPKEKQRDFLFAAKNKLGMDWREFAKLLKISERTLSDWKREKITLPLSAAKIIRKKATLNIPENVKLLSPYWYANKGARKGGLAVLKKYKIIGGNPKTRIKKWREWWEKEGRFKKHPIINKRLSIKKPSFSTKLAEFVGIVLGDGGISKRQVSISLNRETDRDYIRFVKKTITDLFGVSPGLYSDPKSKADTIVISRTELVAFLTQKIGLKIGNKIKQKIDIPRWIRQNKKYEIACLRGLVDTDGSVYKHKYIINNKFYCYHKLSFCSLSPPLLLTVFGILKNIGLKPRIHRNKEIKIENTRNVRKYFEIVGSSNKKHLKKLFLK
ncbi:MAG: LAGLIDADG family homing endonuclease [Parcubacteria group bacterium]|jgi:DNA-binding transcriptional regulator YiaG